MREIGEGNRGGSRDREERVWGMGIEVKERVSVSERKREKERG